MWAGSHGTVRVFVSESQVRVQGDEEEEGRGRMTGLKGCRTENLVRIFLMKA